jgi:glycolate oxidase
VLATGEIVRAGGRTTKNVVGFDLTGLICGSEGMLGIITEATLKLLPLPAATRTVRATFRTMREACACVPAFNRAKIVPVAIEVLDRNSIEAVETEFAFGFTEEAGALLLVSVDGHAEEVERDSLVVERVVRDGGGFDVVRSETREEEERLWDVRRALSPAIKKFGTMKFNEDVVVPRSRVPELIETVTEIGRRYNTFVVNFGHAGDGNIHVNFMCDRDDPEAMRRARACVRETFETSVRLGGTISGEHGIGYVKAPYIEMALGAPTVEMMRRIKHALDPNGILNPGKMLA